jgi:TPR repeat protein
MQSFDASERGILQRQGKAQSCPMCRSELPRSAEASIEAIRGHAQRGQAWAQHSLGHKLRLGGIGLAQDSVAAAEWLVKASEQGFLQSMASLGQAYAMGDGIEADATRARHWLNQAADRGSAEAMFHLGVMLETGQAGVKKDMAQALGWVEQAAELQYNVAECWLGSYWEERKDDDKALDMFRRAAAQGNPTAQYNIGAVLFRTVGEAASPEAMYWARKAKAAGDENAAAICAQLEPLLAGNCQGCGKQAKLEGKEGGVELTRCAKCKTFFYCSKECQRKMWKAGHKKRCIDASK